MGEYREEDEDAKYLATLKADFRNFLFVAYKHLSLDVDPITYEIADYLQNLYMGHESGMVQAMRAIGKSYVTSCFCPWILLHNPNEKIMVVSGYREKALEFIAMSQNLIMELPVLAPLRPSRTRGFDVKRQRWSATQFDIYGAEISQAPSVKATSIDANMTGSRATLIVADDIETDRNSRTIVQREKLRRAAKEFEAIRLPGSFEIWLGTPQSEETIYKEVTRGLAVRQWPARYPHPSEMETRYPHLAPSIKEKAIADPTLSERKTSTVPERYSDEDLLERETRNGRSWFQLHFMLDASLSDQDRYPLKLNDLIVTSLDPHKGPNSITWSRTNVLNDIESVGFTGDRYVAPKHEEENYVPYGFSILAIDPAGLGPDETGVAVLTELNGNIFLQHADGLAGKYDENLEVIALLALKYGVNEIVVESNFGDGMFEELLKPVLRKHMCSCNVEGVKFSSIQGHKERRIISILEPVMNQHRLVVSDKAILHNYRSPRGAAYDLFYQMTRITHEKGALKHDDRLDAAATGVYRMTELMAKDRDQSAETMRDRLLEEAWDDAAVMFNRPGLTRSEMEIDKSNHSNNWIRR